jgi:hypothetical protein
MYINFHSIISSCNTLQLLLERQRAKYQKLFRVEFLVDAINKLIHSALMTLNDSRTLIWIVRQYIGRQDIGRR